MDKEVEMPGSGGMANGMNRKSEHVGKQRRVQLQTKIKIPIIVGWPGVRPLKQPGQLGRVRRPEPVPLLPSLQ